MTNKTDPSSLTAAIRATGRFPQRAMDVVDQLLASLQEARTPPPHPAPGIALDRFEARADMASFVGGGWGALVDSPTPHRWMTRTASLAVPRLDGQNRMLHISVVGRARPAHLKNLAVAADGNLLAPACQRRGVSRWTVSAPLPKTSLTGAPYFVLTLATSGTGHVRGVEGAVSLAVAGFVIE